MKLGMRVVERERWSLKERIQVLRSHRLSSFFSSLSLSLSKGGRNKAVLSFHFSPFLTLTDPSIALSL
jgi:hypothetical protein